MITHRHLLILLAALLMIACSKEEITSVSSEDASINFYVDADVITRAPSNFDTGKQFRVYAWDSNSNPIIYPITNYDASNIVSYNSSTGLWSTTQKYYWPDDVSDEVTFYAFTPTDAPFDTGSKNIVYSSSSPVDGRSDLLYAKTATDKAGSTYTAVSNSYSANINFRHAFCRIDFKANITNTDLKVIINSLQICNVNAHGIFNYPSGSTNTENAETDYGAWDETTISAPTTYTVGITTPVTLTAADTQLGTTNPYLLLIPQTLTPWDPSVTIAANDANATPGCYLKIGCSITIGENEYSDNGYVYCPLTPHWQPANNYTYTLSFGGGYDSVGRPVIQPIVVTTAIKPWNTTTGIDKTIY